jgi:site-specific DNA-methyltransferase (adenine-specific)
MKHECHELRFGDCLTVLKDIETASVDLFYIDPPFFTQKIHALTTRDGSTRYSFKDLWTSREGYGDFLLERMLECRRCLKNSGSLFFHCDENAGHIARLILDQIFQPENFQSEIIWSFKRWSNSKKGLMPSHQTILFYSRSKAFKFNAVTTAYSESTNIDQILQKRVRDERGKAIYARDDEGEPVTNGGKRGVPLGDVWEMPYLNPKARERVGYPTQKPVLLLEKIIELCTDPGDLVVDPFCGSGTTLVAAHLLGRKGVGIDTSQEALALAQQRLISPFKTESRLLDHGRESYVRADLHLLECLKGLEYHAVQRNKGIDAILKEEWHGKPICIRIQRPDETVEDAAIALYNAAERKGGAKLILVVTEPRWGLLGRHNLPASVTLVQSTTAAIHKSLREPSTVEISSSHITIVPPVSQSA